MDYNKWSFASNLSTMIIALFAFIAAITYYFSLTDLDLSYYLLTYIVLIVIVVFIFVAVGIQQKGGRKI